MHLQSPDGNKPTTPSVQDSGLQYYYIGESPAIQQGLHIPKEANPGAQQTPRPPNP